jgi:hypothetical protein
VTTPVAQTLPPNFEWPDLPSQVTPDTGRAPVELPSVLQPWDAESIRALRGFTREVVRRRAELALSDPENERDAQSPLGSVRARWILQTFAEDDAARRSRLPAARGPVDQLESGRDLLTRCLL